ncbi:hypothetical protein [Rhizobium sp. PL01]|uniref:hypothetical protein n=1 Tax=Rhizobium sp. PL01 TaxID=3085631 RepID=UPI00298188B0|nr:hypothetical protein [Rhizobium sp. PL01]MDW5318316.1 hypothetical protein [Rhizobium sp. PL01]
MHEDSHAVFTGLFADFQRGCVVAIGTAPCQHGDDLGFLNAQLDRGPGGNPQRSQPWLLDKFSGQAQGVLIKLFPIWRSFDSLLAGGLVMSDLFFLTPSQLGRITPQFPLPKITTDFAQARAEKRVFAGR